MIIGRISPPPPPAACAKMAMACLPPVLMPAPTDWAVRAVDPSPAVATTPLFSTRAVPARLPEQPLGPAATESEIAAMCLSGEKSIARDRRAAASADRHRNHRYHGG